MVNPELVEMSEQVNLEALKQENLEIIEQENLEETGLEILAEFEFVEQVNFVAFSIVEKPAEFVVQANLEKVVKVDAAVEFAARSYLVAIVAKKNSAVIEETGSAAFVTVVLENLEFAFSE